MKICALLLTAVVVLNSVDKSLQSSSHSRERMSVYHGYSSRRSESPPPTSPELREPWSPKPRFPYLPQGSRIIRDFKFPKGFYYKNQHEQFIALLLHYDVVVNYEGKIVAVFLETWDLELHGLYYGKEGTRVKVTPACIREGKEHVDELDNAGHHYYPEFHYFEKPDGIIIESLKAYTRLNKGFTCEHTPEARGWFFDLPPEAHIVRGVQFPEGFFFKIDEDGLFHPLLHHNCDVVVDPAGMIVAVFLGPSEYKLFGIYIAQDGERVKLTHISMQAQHFKLTRKEEEDLYMEFMPYKKPLEMYKDSFAESDYSQPRKKIRPNHEEIHSSSSFI